jgi:hypothetical protein
MNKRLDDISELAATLAHAAVAAGEVIPFRKNRYRVRSGDWDVFWGKYPDATRDEEMRFADDYTFTAENALNRSST